MLTVVILFQTLYLKPNTTEHRTRVFMLLKWLINLYLIYDAVYPIMMFYWHFIAEFVHFLLWLALYSAFPCLNYSAIPFLRFSFLLLDFFSFSMTHCHLIFPGWKGSELPGTLCGKWLCCFFYWPLGGTDVWGNQYSPEDAEHLSCLGLAVFVKQEPKCAYCNLNCVRSNSF